MTLEVIVQNGAEAIEAEKMGAERLELVSAIQEGGLTPSYGTIKQVLASVSIPVCVMIRPHSYHYLYSEADLEVIHEDIKQVIQLGGRHIVFGTLNSDHTINEAVLQDVLNISDDIHLTFHRAFDETASVIDAYQILQKYNQVKRILTSGGAVDCLTGQDNLQRLVQMENKDGGPRIMPGSGLSLENIGDIHETVQAHDYHFGKSVRIDQSFANGFSKQAMKDIRMAINDKK